MLVRADVSVIVHVAHERTMQGSLNSIIITFSMQLRLGRKLESGCEDSPTVEKMVLLAGGAPSRLSKSLRVQ